MGMTGNTFGYQPTYQHHHGQQSNHAFIGYGQGALSPYPSSASLSPYRTVGNYNQQQYNPYSSGGFDQQSQYGASPIMALMMISIKQMLAYIKTLETSINSSATTETPTSTTTETSTNPETTTETSTNAVDENLVSVEGSKTIDTLGEKHLLDLSADHQEVIVDGKSNVVFAMNNEGSNTYKINGSKNDLIIEQFGPDDTIELDDSALNYSLDITDKGTVKLRNKDNSNSIEMAIDPSMIDANDEKGTLKNILSQIKTPDGNSFWNVVEDQSFNPDKERTTVNKKVGKSKNDKKITHIDGENTHFVLNDVDGGFMKGAREDNIYNLTGHQNVYTVKGDKGANRFVMNNSASKLVVEKFGKDDSLQFIDPKQVEITVEERSGDGWEITMIDKLTGSEVVVTTRDKNHKADFVKERIGEINEEDGLSKSRKKRTKRNIVTKVIAGVALIAASVVTFGGTGAMGAALLGSVGVSAAAGGLGAIAVGTAITAGANFGIGKLLPSNPPQQIGELGAQLGGRPEWLAERLNVENLAG